MSPSALPRVALRPEEAAASLGVSRDFFDEKIAPELRSIRFASGTGRRTVRLYPLRELEAWANRCAARVLE